MEMEHKYPLITALQSGPLVPDLPDFKDMDANASHDYLKLRSFSFDAGYYANMRSQILAQTWKMESPYLQQCWNQWIFANELWCFFFIVHILSTFDGILYLPLVLMTTRLWWISSLVWYALNQLNSVVQQLVNYALPDCITRIQTGVQDTFRQASVLLLQSPGTIRSDIAPPKIHGLPEQKSGKSHLGVAMETVIRMCGLHPNDSSVFQPSNFFALADHLQRDFASTMVQMATNPGTFLTLLGYSLHQIGVSFLCGMRHVLLVPLYIQTAFSLTPLSASVWFQIIMLGYFLKACLSFQEKLVRELATLWWHTDRCLARFNSFDREQIVQPHRPRKKLVLEEVLIYKQSLLGLVLPQALVSLVISYEKESIVVKEVLEIPDPCSKIRIFEVTTCGKFFTYLTPHDDPTRQENIRNLAGKPYYYALAWT